MSLSIGYQNHPSSQAELDSLVRQAQEENKRVVVVLKQSGFTLKVLAKSNVISEFLRRISGQVFREEARLTDFKRSLPVRIESNGTDALVGDALLSAIYPEQRTERPLQPSVSEARSVLDPNKSSASVQCLVSELNAPDKDSQLIKFNSAQKEELSLNEYFLYMLDHTIARIETTFANGTWADADVETGIFARALVALENLKKPDLNLVYCDDIRELADNVKACVENGTQSARFISRESYELRHMSYFEYKLVEGTPSVIQLDSVPFESGGARSLSNAASTALSDLHLNVKFSAITASIQFSNSVCPIFSLNTAKQLSKKPDSLDEIHRLNVQNELDFSDLATQGVGISQYDTPDISKNVEKMLPPNLVKHSQSTKRTQAYLNAHPGAELVAVNKHGKTLATYQNDHAEFPSPEAEKKKIATIFRKRLEYLKELRAAIT
jgi:hypothetical protein